MGRKKQKVRWTSVEDAGFFETDVVDNTTPQEQVPTTPADIMQQRTQDGSYVRFYNKKAYPMSGNRELKRSSSGSSGGFYGSSLPPRFERSHQAKMMYSEQYELDSNCETEELPNGFTKIRSKNLDVLFRKDYYAQRMLSTASSSAVSSEQGEPTPDEDPEVITITTEPPVVEEDENELEESEQNELDSDEQQQKENVNNDKDTNKSESPEAASEVTTGVKKDLEIKSKINSNALPFYPSSYVPPQQATQSFTTTSTSPPAGVGAGTSRPNLFLYSPTSNTMIPCEEIIIPNAVVPGTDVYQGPSNIYLAYPMDQAGTGVASTPSPTSSNCSPPQAQSPPQATPQASLVQYDQYGVPYTAYPTTHLAPNGSAQQPGSSPQPGSAGSADNSVHTSSGESSPPDLSVYHPQNWVPDPQYLANYQQYYQYYPYYYSRNGPNGYHNQYGFHHIESSNVPSSAGDSQNEDADGRSDNETTPTTATTTTSNSPKKEASAASKEANGGPNDRIIPGLNLVKNPPRQTKKRRKKKATTTASASTSNAVLNIEAACHGGHLHHHHRGSSSSEANEKNVLKAITILQRNTADNKMEAAEAAEAEISTTTTTSENSTPPEIEIEAGEIELKDQKVNEMEASAEVKPDLLQLEDEEVIVVVEDVEAKEVEDVIEEQHTECAEAEPEPVPEVLSFKKPHRRRRGARKSERKNKSNLTHQVSNEDNAPISEEPATAEVVAEVTEATPVKSEDDHQWEFVPTEIQDEGSGWETMKIKKSASKKLGMHTPKESRDSTPVQSNRLVIQPDDQEITTPQINSEPETVQADPAETEVQVQDNDQVSSAPASRKSTLKRTKKKKSMDAGASGSSENKSSLTKPVLISDRDFDVASAAAQRRYHSAFEVLDEEKIKEVAAMTDKKGTFDTLYISDIGHGMGGGPITLGRFGLGKYVPPDRSSEIYPIPMQKNDQEDQSKVESIEELDLKNESKAQETQKSIIRAMMQEVIKSNNLPQNTLPTSENKAGLTYIRDAERFTEMTAPAAPTQCPAAAAATKTVPIPDAIVNKTKTQELDLD